MPRPVQSEQPAEREFSAGMGRPQREARFNFQARPLAEDPGDGRSGGVSQGVFATLLQEAGPAGQSPWAFGYPKPIGLVPRVFG
jgi:hypothetical protein